MIACVFVQTTMMISHSLVIHCLTCSSLLRDQEVKVKYQLLITNSFVQDHPHLKWCPAPGCPNAVLVTNVDYRPVICECGHSFW